MEISRESIEELDKERDVENARKIEAALFIAGRFLSVAELVALTDINPILLKKALEELQEQYKERGVEIVEQNEKWKMDVAAEFSSIVNRLASGESEFSKAEQETLAIIAHKRQMKQSIVVKIRGNKAYDHIKRFVEMGLINKKKIGHTAELTLSDKFHEYFHLDGKAGEGGE